jgi:nucleoside-diphosphate-sugar epimerase
MSHSNNSNTGQTIALTGATGFLGSHVLTALIQSGFKVKALTRKPQVELENVVWVIGSLDNPESLDTLVDGADTLIHLAGLTKALSRDVFFDVNVKGSLSLFNAAAKANIQHIVHISSLAARKPELSHYGASKAGTELLLTARKWPFSWTILRPPAIYGPGDKEILKLFQATHFGILPAPGSKKNRFSMIHAADMAQAISALCDGSNKAGILEIDDGKTGGYTVADIAHALPESENKSLKKIALPFLLMAALGAANQLISSITRKPAMLTVSTARYLCHSDWTVREPRRFRHAQWMPHFDLKKGLDDTIEWYRKNGLL